MRPSAGTPAPPAPTAVTPERFHPDSVPAPLADSAAHIRSAEAPADGAPPAPVDSAPPAPPPPARAAPAPAPVPTPDPAPARVPAPRAPPPAAVPADPRPAIQRVVAEYAAAVESQSVSTLRDVYPLMTPEQARGWEQFFGLVRDVKAQLAVSRLEVTGGTAVAQIAGTYTYRNTSTQSGERQPVSFRATLRRDGDRWRILQIH